MLKTSTIIKACLFSNVIYFQVHKSTSLGDKLFEEPCYAEHKPYELLLLSPGGTGSSSGYAYFHDHGVGYTDMNSDEDRDGLKHKNFFDLFKTMKLCNISSKLIVYQFDDPVKSILSLFRRKYEVWDCAFTAALRTRDPSEYHHIWGNGGRRTWIASSS